MFGNEYVLLSSSSLHWTSIVDVVDRMVAIEKFSSIRLLGLSVGWMGGWAMPDSILTLMLSVVGCMLVP